MGLLQSALNESGLPPEAVEIELTETSILRAEQSIFKTLPALKELGIQVALDDFGTGYSSLSYLRQLPVDKLKIDTSFVRHITVDPKDAAIVSAILAMAENLKTRWWPRASKPMRRSNFFGEETVPIFRDISSAGPYPAMLCRAPPRGAL